MLVGCKWLDTVFCCQYDDLTEHPVSQSCVTRVHGPFLWYFVTTASAPSLKGYPCCSKVPALDDKFIKA